MTNKTSFQGRMRQLLRDNLHTAGDIVTITDEQHSDPARLRPAAKQSANMEGMVIALRTIDGKIVARREDLPPVMPGTSMVHQQVMVLLSMRPWPDDILYDQKMAYIERNKTW